MKTTVKRPARVVSCVCDRGWHLNLMARDRCPAWKAAPRSPGIQAALDAGVGEKERAA